MAPPPSTLENHVVAPDFVMVQYDVEVNTGSLRGQLRELLYDNSMRMLTQSVYYGPYSEKLLAAVEQLAAKRAGMTLLITTPAYPADQAKNLMRRYEQAFVAMFDEMEEKLEWIEQALANDKDLLAEQNKGKPYTGEQIMFRVRTCEQYVETLHTQLGHRRERESDPKVHKNLDKLALRLRSADAHIGKLRDATKKRMAKEALAPGQQVIK